MWQDELSLAISAARDAGAVLMRYFRQDIKRILKAPGDIVTRADRESETLLRATLLDACPGHAFLGEEEGLSGDSEFVWVVDPLDGTLNFARGLPAFTVCIGLLHRKEPVVGVVYDPVHEDLYAAARGGGATLNGETVVCPPEPMDSTSLVALPSAYLKELAPPYVNRVLSRCRWRDLGCASLHICMVGTGSFACAVFEKTKLWDIAAPSLFAMETGAFQYDLDGNTAYPLAHPWDYYREGYFSSLTVNPGVRDVALTEVFRPEGR